MPELSEILIFFHEPKKPPNLRNCRLMSGATEISYCCTISSDNLLHNHHHIVLICVVTLSTVQSGRNFYEICVWILHHIGMWIGLRNRTHSLIFIVGVWKVLMYRSINILRHLVIILRNKVEMVKPEIVSSYPIHLQKIRELCS